MGGEGLILALPPGISSADPLPVDSAPGEISFCNRGATYEHAFTGMDQESDLAGLVERRDLDGLSRAQPNLDFLKPHLQNLEGDCQRQNMLMSCSLEGRISALARLARPNSSSSL